MLRPPRLSLSSALFGLLGTIFIVFLFLIFFGSVSGWEFSPHTFQRRTFFYVQIPGLQWQIGPTARGNVADAFTGDFVVQGWLPPSSIPPKVWHRASFALATGTLLSDPRILWNYLAWPDSAPSKWQGWSKSNPEQARALWPLVSLAAQNELYYVIPEMFAATTELRDLSALQASLRQILLSELQVRSARAHNDRDDPSATRFAAAATKLAAEFSPQGNATTNPLAAPTHPAESR